MHPMTNRSLTAVVAAAVLALTVLFGSAASHAQPFPPPCGAANLTIINMTGCDFKFCLKGFTGGITETHCWPVLASQTIVVANPPGFAAAGVVNTATNTTHPFVPSFIVTAPWWVPNITLGLCCCNVYYDPATCTIWIRPAAGPC